MHDLLVTMQQSLRVQEVSTHHQAQRTLNSPTYPRFKNIELAALHAFCESSLVAHTLSNVRCFVQTRDMECRLTTVHRQGIDSTTFSLSTSLLNGIPGAYYGQGPVKERYRYGKILAPEALSLIDKRRGLDGDGISISQLPCHVVII